MDSSVGNGHSRWAERATRWHRRLAELGLDGLLVALGQALRPVGPLAAQVLWVAQPTLSIFSTSLSRDTGALADLLYDPMALDDLLSQLTLEEVE